MGLVTLAMRNSVVGEVCNCTCLSAMPKGRSKTNRPLRTMATDSAGAKNCCMNLLADLGHFPVLGAGGQFALRRAGDANAGRRGAMASEAAAPSICLSAVRRLVGDMSLSWLSAVLAGDVPILVHQLRVGEFYRAGIRNCKYRSRTPTAIRRREISFPRALGPAIRRNQPRHHDRDIENTGYTPQTPPPSVRKD